MSKSPDAFRTISEVSDILGTPAHVLRFWESKFSQIKPVKRAGGRRYYRPQDISLLAGIKHLLHVQGMTIKGAQKLLREKGVKHVAGMVDLATGDVVEPAAPAPVDAPPEAAPTATAPAPESEDADVDVAEEQAPAAPTPAPAAPVAAAPQPDLPFEPAPAPEPRFFAALQHASTSGLASRANDIAPLVARLQAVKDRMQAP